MKNVPTGCRECGARYDSREPFAALGCPECGNTTWRWTNSGVRYKKRYDTER